MMKIVRFGRYHTLKRKGMAAEGKAREMIARRKDGRIVDDAQYHAIRVADP